MELVLFEDQRVAELAPITWLRPAYAISCGGYRLLDLIGTLQLPVYGSVRSSLIETQQLDYGWRNGDYPLLDDGNLLLINARLVPTVELLGPLQQLLDRREPGFFAAVDGSLALGVLPAEMGRAIDILRYPTRDALIASDLAEILWERPLEVFQYPHDVVLQHQQICAANLRHRAASETYREIANGVFAQAGVSLPSTVATDTSAGPVVVDAGAIVEPFCYLKGPIYLASQARVLAHTTLQGPVTAGPVTRLGGEIGASILEAYSNKQHNGYLGHSYIGSWVNLGAGTNTSNLKNTYGPIAMQYADRRVVTKSQFMGSIVGDLTKTAVNTAIYTGKVIGVGSMLYGTVAENVPSFVNYAQQFGQQTAVSWDVLVETQKRMFARRQVAQRECDIRLLRQTYEATELERRHLPCQPLRLASN